MTAAAQGAAGNDIRILIDVSGSMKRNDPDNLRVPALKLITGLLPRNSQAGVWTFGRYVNMLVPHGTVDDNWRNRAMAAAEQISSHGLYTNMEATLADATWDWKQAGDGESRRSVILLTDGYVDISPDKQKNSASRERILNDILPRLQRAGVTIHTIALSDDADHLLLRQLATASGGRYKKASAEGLERIFFHLFEEATAPQTLPLVDNSVLVDDSIEELTLLIFRRPAAPPTRLTTPHGIEFGAERLPPNVRWHHEKRYDLITIERPMVGTWQVAADMDPDNRVMVVSDLNVITTRLPDNLGLGERYTFLVSLTEQGRVIEKKEFLHFVKVTVKQENSQGGHWEWLLLDNGRHADAAPGDGTYTLELDESLEPGTQRLSVDVDGTTFRRHLQQTFHVHNSPVEAVIETVDGIPALFVIPRAGMIEPDSMAVTAVIFENNGAIQETLAVPRLNHNQWQLDLGAYQATGAYRLEVQVQGSKPDGKPLQVTVGPLHFGTPPPSPPSAEEDSEAAAVVSEDAPETDSGGPVNQEAGFSWLWVVAQVILINFLLIGGLIFAYRKWLCFEVRVPKSWQQAPQEQA